MFLYIKGFKACNSEYRRTDCQKAASLQKPEQALTRLKIPKNMPIS